MTLADVKRGGAAIVRRVEGGDAMALRLAEMGFTPGTPVRVTRRAPLGDPLEIALRGYRLTMRARDARRVVCDVKAGE